MNAVLEHYSKWHEAYLSSYGEVLQACRDKDLAAMLVQIGHEAGIKPGMKVLDCGGGYGLTAAFLSRVFEAQLTSINITPCQLEVAQKKYSSFARYLLHDMNKIKDLGEEFDRILFLESLGHSENIESVLQQAFESLTKNGVLYIKHPACEKMDKTFSEVSQFWAYTFYPRTEVVKAALKAGFSIVSVKETSYQNFDFDFVARFKEHVPSGVNCFVDFDKPNYRDLLYVDFIFKKAI